MKLYKMNFLIGWEQFPVLKTVLSLVIVNWINYTQEDTFPIRNSIHNFIGYYSTSTYTWNNIQNSKYLCALAVPSVAGSCLAVPHCSEARIFFKWSKVDIFVRNSGSSSLMWIENRFDCISIFLHPCIHFYFWTQNKGQAA